MYMCKPKYTYVNQLRFTYENIKLIGILLTDLYL